MIEPAALSSEERLSLALEASGMGIWMWDALTDAVTWTRECYAIHGLREGEFAGTPAAFDRLLHPEDREHQAHA
jgi:PAS domain-containing protein